ncbi:hypothetical protein [Mesorhizobium sp. KR9-304]|uniref:hypothetical protein n=1 Tax=Mesorhizobium sp. KR9-304 TaxID=3156614 RepID=UPI0032B39B06
MGKIRTPNIVSDVHRVEHQPSWRRQGFNVNFIFLSTEYAEKDLISVHEWAQQQGLENPRCISPQTLRWSALFQPRFFEAMRRAAISTESSLCLAYPGSECLLADADSRLSFWMQSVLFLAAVTLSAAVVQDRASEGTIASKYDKLWQAGLLETDVPKLAGTGLCHAVAALAARKEDPKLRRLLDLRDVFDQAVARLATSVSARAVRVRQIDRSDPRMTRFGFVGDLQSGVTGLVAVIVYGSSVLSDHFADYDVVLVVDDAEATLSALSNTSPRWAGKELNVGIYTPRQLWDMQLLSGDNLADYGLCVFGEVELPQKRTPLLLARNLSFGMVRLRQQLGMIGHALAANNSDGDDRRNLYSYFVKIPANIAKGTFGAAGQHWPKEKIWQWLAEHCGFDASGQEQRVAIDGPAGPLAAAATATERTLRRLDEEFRILGPG